MGSGHRLAAVAAASHARHYNHTDAAITDAPQYSVNALFVSATLCGVLVAVCAGCWRRAAPAHKPAAVDCRGVYTVSGDDRLAQIPDELTGPPPAYDSVVIAPAGLPIPKDGCILEEVVTDPCDPHPERTDNNGLPSYEAAVMLRDTKL